MVDTKEARTALKSARSNLELVISRNELLERTLDRACDMLTAAQKYIGDGAYIPRSGGNEQIRCRDKIANDVAELRRVLDA